MFRPCQDLQASELLKKNAKPGQIRSKSSLQSIFLCVAPFWAVCFFILTAYIQCIHEQSPEERQKPHFFSPDHSPDHIVNANLAPNEPIDEITAAPTKTPSPGKPPQLLYHGENGINALVIR